jgi:hypothetical protein
MCAMYYMFDRLQARLGTVEQLWLDPDELRLQGQDSDEANEAGDRDDASDIWSDYGDEVSA